MTTQHFLYFFHICFVVGMLCIIYHQLKLYWRFNGETINDYWRQIQDWWEPVT